MHQPMARHHDQTRSACLTCPQDLRVRLLLPMGLTKLLALSIVANQASTFTSVDLHHRPPAKPCTRKGGVQHATPTGSSQQHQHQTIRDGGPMLQLK
ncbi:protein bassoon [Lates japonicus]|uniref:Protein bassoon n=1 Tax=Lates japonicus TaxID=270547 RepID=A0AAD3RNL4_LATJO|nr:protein bassoon [Lates japonicus]